MTNDIFIIPVTIFHNSLCFLGITKVFIIILVDAWRRLNLVYLIRRLGIKHLNWVWWFWKNYYLYRGIVAEQQMDCYIFALWLWLFSCITARSNSLCVLVDHFVCVSTWNPELMYRISCMYFQYILCIFYSRLYRLLKLQWSESACFTSVLFCVLAAFDNQVLYL